MPTAVFIYLPLSTAIELTDLFYLKSFLSMFLHGFTGNGLIVNFNLNEISLVSTCLAFVALLSSFFKMATQNVKYLQKGRKGCKKRQPICPGSVTFAFLYSRVKPLLAVLEGLLLDEN